MILSYIDKKKPPKSFGVWLPNSLRGLITSLGSILSDRTVHKYTNYFNIQFNCAKKLLFVLFCAEFVLIKFFIINYLNQNSTKKQKNLALKNHIKIKK